MPAVTKTMSEPRRAPRNLVGRLFGSPRAHLGIAARAQPPRSPSPMCSAWARLDINAWLSVLTATKSTPAMPASIMRLTALLPPPPTPTTRMSAAPSTSGILCTSLRVPSVPIFTPLVYDSTN
jgi:hypothetical protein